MALTGREDGPPLGPPAGLVAGVRSICDSIARASGVELDGLAMLAERAAIAGLARHGDRSCGEATRLLRAADGWIAVTLARDDDIASVPAWLETEQIRDVWPLVTQAVAQRQVAPLVERARLLSLPVAALGCDTAGITARPSGATRTTDIADAMVADLSALWAGPLCGHILQLAGARVIKVESTGRPDGARRGPEAFFDLMNGGKESVALDFDDDEQLDALQRLVAAADVVIEASRPRVLESLGIGRADHQVWVSITGYGRGSDGVAFGDDGAVAGGLVVEDERGPCFCADAIADPLTGLVAADLALGALAAGHAELIDVPLAGVAARFAGPTLQVDDPVDVAAPTARRLSATAPGLGADTDHVLAGL
ncbi:MAG: CoA transferase [Acidimicrobiia bacterium]|nr:CoA transferase [Acidimicrobiia bacterium]